MIACAFAQHRHKANHVIGAFSQSIKLIHVDFNGVKGGLDAVGGPFNDHRFPSTKYSFRTSCCGGVVRHWHYILKWSTAHIVMSR